MTFKLLEFEHMLYSQAMNHPTFSNIIISLKQWSEGKSTYEKSICVYIDKLKKNTTDSNNKINYLVDLATQHYIIVYDGKKQTPSDLNIMFHKINSYHDEIARLYALRLNTLTHIKQTLCQYEHSKTISDNKKLLTSIHNEATQMNILKNKTRVIKQSYYKLTQVILNIHNLNKNIKNDPSNQYFPQGPYIEFIPLEFNFTLDSHHPLKNKFLNL
jgi:DNA repair exonuclease SbcCD ATPase subunit